MKFNYYIPLNIDLLMIDSEHTKEQLEMELENFVPFVRRNGFICLHDINKTGNIDMYPAFENFIEKTNYPYFYIDYKQGFVVIKKID